MYRPKEEGGLGLQAVGAWCTATYMAKNVAAWWRWVGAEAERVAREAEDTMEDSDSNSEQGSEEQSQDSEQEEEEQEGGAHGRRVRAMWAAYGCRWANSQWAQEWWWQEQDPYQQQQQEGQRRRLNQSWLRALPDHLREWARMVWKLKVEAKQCRGEEQQQQSLLHKETAEERRLRERQLRDAIYQQILREMAAQRERERSQRRRRQQEQQQQQQPPPPLQQERWQDDPQVAREVFAANTNRVPFSLWELRWRAFHRVLAAGGGVQQWVQAEVGQCPVCRDKGRRQQGGGQVPKDTLAHFVKECPDAQALWEAVARRFRWPRLAQQSWQTVLSGVRPRQGGPVAPGGVDASLTPPPLPGPQQRKAPVAWELVRLVNLAVLKALGLQRQRAKEDRIRGRTRAGPPLLEPWVRICTQTLWAAASWEKGLRKGRGALSRFAWYMRWGWLGSPTIT